MASHSLLLLLLLVTLVALESSSNGGTSNETTAMEKDELLGLFEVLGSLLEDPNWSQMHPSPCTDTPWPGVQCEIDTESENPQFFHVTKIHIGPDLLDPPCKSSATLSKSLLKLKYLKTLSIFNCFLTKQVSLSPTLFETFSSSLEHLALVSNPSLVGDIPQSLTKMENLRILILSQNNLQEKIPIGISGLVNLEQFDLSYNNLVGEIPQEIGGLSHLSILDLSWNRFEGIVPYTLGHLQNLQKIDLSCNRLISRIPQELGKLKNLVLLDLSHNFITGPLPETLSGMVQIEYLIIENCPINTGIPLFLRSLKKLTTLSLSGCGLKGSIPNYFFDLKNLTSLSLDNNDLGGTIPTNIGYLPYLDQLNLSQNMLSGELMLKDEFIKRLGKRLDVRGNHGLCTSNGSTNLGILSCLDTKSWKNESWVVEEGPRGIERVKPPNWYHENQNMSSNTSRLHQIFMSPIFVACLLSFLMYLSSTPVL